MAQEVSRRPLIAEPRVYSQAFLCGICGGRICTGTAFTPVYFGFPMSV